MTAPITLGQFHTLEVAELVEGGLLLDAGQVDLFLPTHLAPAGVRVGDELEVFIYSDGEGAPQATTREPAGVLGEAAFLECVAVTRGGAYLAWGIPKDLLVPRDEREEPMVEGRRYVAVITLDGRGERLIASTKVSRHLDYDVAHLAVDQEVEVLVYGHIDAGTQVVVERRHRGLIHHTKVHRELAIGSVHRGFIRNIREDNRLDIELTRRGAEGSEDAQAVLLQALERAGGSLPLHDKSDPSEISRLLGISKKAFKRAAGGLYKARRIVIHDDSIALVEH
ncbi:MAG: hypothetical protein KC731_15105 [Myxococcales bacterium]|nr:hypothetical protein [Myxococcales bacterium]